MRPLWPPPTTTASHSRAASSDSGAGSPTCSEACGDLVHGAGSWLGGLAARAPAASASAIDGAVRDDDHGVAARAARRPRGEQQLADARGQPRGGAESSGGAAAGAGSSGAARRLRSARSTRAGVAGSGTSATSSSASVQIPPEADDEHGHDPVRARRDEQLGAGRRHRARRAPPAPRVALRAAARSRRAHLVGGRRSAEQRPRRARSCGAAPGADSLSATGPPSSAGGGDGVVRAARRAGRRRRAARRRAAAPWPRARRASARRRRRADARPRAPIVGDPLRVGGRRAERGARRRSAGAQPGDGGQPGLLRGRVAVASPSSSGSVEATRRAPAPSPPPARTASSTPPHDAAAAPSTASRPRRRGRARCSTRGIGGEREDERAQRVRRRPTAATCSRAGWRRVAAGGSVASQRARASRAPAPAAARRAPRRGRRRRSSRRPSRSSPRRRRPPRRAPADARAPWPARAARAGRAPTPRRPPRRTRGTTRWSPASAPVWACAAAAPASRAAGLEHRDADAGARAALERRAPALAVAVVLEVERDRAHARRARRAPRAKSAASSTASLPHETTVCRRSPRREPSALTARLPLCETSATGPASSRRDHVAPQRDALGRRRRCRCRSARRRAARGAPRRRRAAPAAPRRRSPRAKPAANTTAPPQPSAPAASITAGRVGGGDRDDDRVGRLGQVGQRAATHGTPWTQRAAAG